MADITFSYASAFATQSVLGTFDGTLSTDAGTGGAFDLAKGLVYGDADSGIGGSGIDFSVEPDTRPNQPISGSRSAQDPVILGEKIGGFTVTLPLSGPRTTTTSTPVDGDFTHQKGYNALLGCAGMPGAAAAGSPGPSVGWLYKVGAVAMSSGVVWDSDELRHYLKDLRADAVFTWTPNEIPTVAFALKGNVDAASTSFTAIVPDYEEMISVQPPAVENVVATFNGVQRDIQDLSIALNNGIAEVPRANLDGGRDFKPVGAREVLVTATLWSNDASQPVAEYDALIASVAGADLEFTVGTAASGSDAALAHQVGVTNLRVLSHQVLDVNDTKCRGVTFTAQATAASADSEFWIAFL